LTSADSNHIIAVTADVYDETQGKYQSEVNKNLIDEIEELKLSGGGGGGGTPSGDLSDYAKIEYVDDEVQKAKDYTDEQIDNIDIPELPTLATVATSGSYNDLKDTPTIPSVEGLATTTEVEGALTSANTYTDEKFNSIDIPTELSELTQDATHRLVTDTEKASWNAKSDFSGNYNDLENKPTIPDVSDLETKEVVAQNLADAKQYTDDKTAVLATKEEVETAFTEFEGVVEQGFYTKQDKTAIVTASDVVSVDKRSVIDVTDHVVISLESYEEDGYAHSYEIVLNIGDTAYSVAFDNNIKWVKGLEIEPNARYYIIIEDNTAMWTVVSLS
jgi:hypothetical protein